MAKYMSIKGEEVGYEYLSKYFYYNPDTGEIRHKFIDNSDLPSGFSRSTPAWNRRKAFRRAEIISRTAPEYSLYVVELFLNRSKGKTRIISHRLAWVLYYKEWPEGEIDHLDGDPLNNKINNLRDCKDTTKNRRNVVVDRKRKFPRGVRFYLSGAAKTPTFRAYYHRDGDTKLITLYCGRDYFEACCARKSWENEMLKNPENGYTPRHFGRE